MTTGPNGSMDKVAAPQAMGSAARSDAVRRPRHRLVAGAAAGGALLMLCAAYAAVPIYKLICEATGMNGTTRRAERAPGVVSDARMRVRFNATVASGLPWDFKPAVAHVDVRLGETTLAHYEALNRSVRLTSGTATFNVTPEIVGKYFSKIECFCFTRQDLAGGQKADMAVTFFIDPAILVDRDAQGVEEVFLSYTFFATPGADVAQKAATGSNREVPPPAGAARSIE